MHRWQKFDCTNARGERQGWNHWTHSTRCRITVPPVDEACTGFLGRLAIREANGSGVEDGDREAG